jgi:hypothetical protein
MGQKKAVDAIKAFLQDGQRVGNLYETATSALYVYNIDREGLPEGWIASKVNTYLHPESLDPFAQPTEKTREERALRIKIYEVLGDPQVRNQTWQQLCDKIDPLARAVIHAAKNVPNRAEIDAKHQASIGLGMALFEQFSLQFAAAEVDQVVATATAHSDPATIEQVEAAMGAHERAVEQRNAELQQQVDRNLNQLTGQRNQPPARPTSSCCAIL